MSQEIENKVIELIVEHLAVSKDKLLEEDGKLKHNLKFMEDLEADSLDLVEFVMSMEEAYGFDVPDEDQEKLRTTGDVVNYIASKQAVII